MNKVLLDPSFRRMEEIFSARDLERLYECCEVIWGRNEVAPEPVVNEVAGELFAIVSPSWRYGPLTEFPKLKAILEVGGRHPSAKTLDYAYCHANHVYVLSCAPAFGPMVAEMALGMAIDAAREITSGHNAFQSGSERYLWHGNENTFTLYGKRVGLIGVGGLAAALIPLLKPFNVELVGYDPWRTDAFLANRGVTSVSLEALLESCDVVFVLAIPSTENRAFLDREKLERLQKHAVFVLISRSHVVDFEALTDLLYENRFRAAIDVFPTEPLPANHRIRQAPNVVLSAHRAGSIVGDSTLIGEMVVDDLEALTRGLPPWRMQRAEAEYVAKLP